MEAETTLLAVRALAVAAEMGLAAAAPGARGAKKAEAEPGGAEVWEVAVKAMVVAVPVARRLVVVVAAVTGWAAAVEEAGAQVAVEAREVAAMEKVAEALGKEAVARVLEEEERVTETAEEARDTAEMAVAMASTEAAVKATEVAARERAVVATVTVDTAVLGSVAEGKAAARVVVGTWAAEARVVGRARRCNIHIRSNRHWRRRPHSTPRWAQCLRRTWCTGRSPH